MAAVSITYILMAQEGFRLDRTVSYAAGILVSAGALLAYFVVLFFRKPVAGRQNTAGPGDHP